MKTNTMMMKWLLLVLIQTSYYINTTEGFQNLTPYGRANQSGSYSEGTYTYDAQRATDGNKNQDFNNRSCSHTPVGPSTAWWSLDFKQKVNINRVIIYYRSDQPGRFDGVYLFISDTFTSSNPKSGHQCFHDPMDNNDRAVIRNITCNTIGQYVVIYNERTPPVWAFLELCEVVILGCAFGKYGNNCDYNCSSYCQGSTCDIWTGSCSCLKGYRGEKCDELCVKGTYGLNCTETCYNCLSDNCNAEDGVCLEGCKAGWRDSKCAAICFEGTYGLNCSKTCHNCLSGKCNPQDGVCDGNCKPGWKGFKCDDECESGTFGYNCTGRCGSCKEGCKNIDGICLSPYCLARWKGPKCDEVCNQRTFGVDCKKMCHCLNDTSCHNVHGHCLLRSCERGWRGDSCDQRCGTGTFGYDCNSTCRGCIDDVCEVEFGNCTKDGCKSGFSGGKCDIRASAFENPTNYTAVVGGGFSTGVVLLFVIIIFIYRKRRGRKNKTPSYGNSPVSMAHTDLTCQSGHVNKIGEVVEYVNVEKTTKWITDQLISNDSKEFEDESKKQNVNATESSKTENVYLNFEASANATQYTIPISDLQAAVENKTTRNEWDAEFAMLPMGSHYFPCNEALKEENKQKNRFLTTFAYDHSRVKLVGNGNTDYINANYLKSFNNDRAYIATQGPKKLTLKDFWQMIWQENAGKIVMVTRLKEGEKKKCEQYWPQSTRAALVIGNFTLTMKEETEHTIYTYRCIEVTYKEDAAKRSIHHFHFTQWPDHGVPDKTSLVHFQRKVKSTVTDLTGPIVVHCSAGIGRTGTYIALDALFDHGKKTGFVDVMDYTKIMRKDRMNMIQTVDQYIMVHDALVEAFYFENTAIPANKFAEMFEAKKRQIKGKNETVLHGEYRKLVTIRPKNDPSKFQAGKRRENSIKNALPTILPLDDYRPFILSYGPLRNDYINAVIIPAFANGKNFIVTQYPLMDTVGDFWSLVYDHHCRILVLLEGQHTNVSFFPEDERQEFSFDNFIISVRSKEHTKGRLTIALRHVKHNDDVRHVTVYVTDSITKSNTEKNVIDFVGNIYSEVGRTKNSFVVLCRDGCTQCGVFVTLSLAMEEIEMDEEVDIFQIARRIQARRPEFIKDFDQYEWCYRCISEYLSGESLYANT